MSEQTAVSKVEELLNEPASVSDDAGSVQNIRIQDAIAAEEHLARKAASTAKNARFGFGVAVLRGPRQY